MTAGAARLKGPRPFLAAALETDRWWLWRRAAYFSTTGFRIEDVLTNDCVALAARALLRGEEDSRCGPGYLSWGRPGTRRAEQAHPMFNAWFEELRAQFMLLPLVQASFLLKGPCFGAAPGVRRARADFAALEEALAAALTGGTPPREVALQIIDLDALHAGVSFSSGPVTDPERAAARAALDWAHANAEWFTGLSRAILRFDVPTLTGHRLAAASRRRAEAAAA